jgi:hypothetical protein
VSHDITTRVFDLAVSLLKKSGDHDVAVAMVEVQVAWYLVERLPNHPLVELFGSSRRPEHPEVFSDFRQQDIDYDAFAHSIRTSFPDYSMSCWRKSLKTSGCSGRLLLSRASRGL